MDIKSVKITYTGNVINAKGEDVTTLEKTYLVGKDDVSNGTTSIYGVLNDNFNVYLPKDISATKTFKFTTVDGQEINVTTSPYVYKVDKEGKETFNWKYIGISNHTTNRGFGRVMKDSFETFGEYSIALYKALGQIFTKQGFEQLGGPIAIVQQQMTFSNQGFGQFLLFWGLISINLAIINLLPFPGLDGWHFLVVIVEGITRKEISQKFKAIMSTIGMILLFGLMIAITFKDVFRLFIK